MFVMCPISPGFRTEFLLMYHVCFVKRSVCHSRFWHNLKIKLMFAFVLLIALIHIHEYFHFSASLTVLPVCIWSILVSEFRITVALLELESCVE